jgi:charged multivesicular body protein 2A
MASMNRGLNLPGIQRIMNDFEKESAMMDMKEEMMSDAVDDVMDEEEDEEEEGDKILREVLDEIGVSLAHEVRSSFPTHSYSAFVLPLVSWRNSLVTSLLDWDL